MVSRIGKGRSPMGRYLIRRLIQAFFIIIIITVVTFAIVRASSDPMAQFANNKNVSTADRVRIRKSLGLDEPMYMQYLYWLGNTAQGNFGYSFTTKEPVGGMIMERLPQTLILMGAALALQSYALYCLESIQQRTNIPRVTMSSPRFHSSAIPCPSFS